MQFQRTVEVEFLRALPVFSGCTHEELKALAAEADQLIVLTESAFNRAITQMPSARANILGALSERL